MPNIGKSSSSEVYKNSGGVEASNNTLTTEKRKINKINKTSDRRTKGTKEKKIILSDSIVKDIEG